MIVKFDVKYLWNKISINLIFPLWCYNIAQSFLDHVWTLFVIFTLLFPCLYYPSCGRLPLNSRAWIWQGTTKSALNWAHLLCARSRKAQHAWHMTWRSLANFKYLYKWKWRVKNKPPQIVENHYSFFLINFHWI